MPNPNWTAEYAFNALPEANGFTREVVGAPVQTIVTSGSPANRRVELQSDQGSVIFHGAGIPLNEVVGATMECIVNVTGVGDAGFELTFLERHIGIQIYASRVTVTLPDGQEPHEILTPSNGSNTTFRATLIRIAGVATLNLHRAGAPVPIGTFIVPAYSHASPRVLFWGEEGGTQIFRALRYWLGGAMAPG